MQRHAAPWVPSVLRAVDSGEKEKSLLGLLTCCADYSWLPFNPAELILWQSCPTLCLSLCTWSIIQVSVLIWIPGEPRWGVNPTRSSLFWKDEFSATLADCKSSLIIISTKTNYLLQTESLMETSLPTFGSHCQQARRCFLFMNCPSVASLNVQVDI